MSNEIIDVQPQGVVQANAFNVEALISEAIKQGTPVDTMERILAMRRELKAEFAKEAFDRAMAKFQSECPVIQKTKTVRTDAGAVAYKYAPIESIVEQVKVPLQTNGFSYSTNMRMLESGVEVTVKVTHSAGHSELTQMTVPFGAKTRVMSDTQVVAAASTFAKRYAFCNAFGILTGDEDNDAQPLPQQPARTAKPVTPGKPATLSPITLDFINKLGTATTVEEYKDISAAINEAKDSKAISQPEYTAIVNAAKQAVRRIEDLKNQPPVIVGTTQEIPVSEEDVEQIAKDVGLV
jgi:hypothetical protein